MTRIFHWFFMWKMDLMSGCDIRLVFTLPPRDSTLQYKRCLHLWNNFPCISTLSGIMSVYTMLYFKTLSQQKRCSIWKSVEFWQFLNFSPDAKMRKTKNPRLKIIDFKMEKLAPLFYSDKDLKGTIVNQTQKVIWNDMYSPFNQKRLVDCVNLLLYLWGKV